MPLRKIRLLVGVAGNGYTYDAGSIQEMPELVAERYVNSGQAEYVEPAPVVANVKAKRGRKATRPPSETR